MPGSGLALPCHRWCSEHDGDVIIIIVDVVVGMRVGEGRGRGLCGGGGGGVASILVLDGSYLASHVEEEVAKPELVGEHNSVCITTDSMPGQQSPLMPLPARPPLPRST